MIDYILDIMVYHKTIFGDRYASQMSDKIWKHCRINFFADDTMLGLENDPQNLLE